MLGQKRTFSFLCIILWMLEVQKMDLSLVFTVLGIIITVISMIACPIIAKRKNRSVAGWFFAGLFLGLIGLIVVACLPRKD